VWKSSISFNNLTAVYAACGLTAPACGAGLSCWPGEPHTTFYSNGSVTCPASRACARLPPLAYLDFDVQTGAAGWSGRFAANAEVFGPSFTYHDVFGIQRTAPRNSLILQGGQSQNNGQHDSRAGQREQGSTAAVLHRLTAPLLPLMCCRRVDQH
jgi:hypothetical protein